ncbi:phosphatidate cytidylyltransferase [Myxacorys almedinensis A]|uniref:Phosphatidate cytidylyltransferase n=1 Tax=Myxacorys almedinensis A TaxID=2690445 RepID=A0A8J7Z1E3_9CYAN|nr:phosphatidate cytidylyltransferase [Myxacorys almedinensis A]
MRSALSAFTPLNLPISIAIAALWILLIGLLAEGAYRYTQAGTEIVRKIVHIGAGNVILLAWLLNIPRWVGVSASILFSAIALLSYSIPILPGINGVGRKSLGTFFYAVSIGVLVAWFWTLHLPQFAAIGILVMTWGDGLAALIGQRFGRHTYTVWGMKKSWEGSLTMALVSFAVSLAILIATQGNGWQGWLISLTIAAVATTLEAFSKFGIDNLTVPIGSAAFAFFLSQLFWG